MRSLRWTVALQAAAAGARAGCGEIRLDRHDDRVAAPKTSPPEAAP